MTLPRKNTFIFKYFHQRIWSHLGHLRSDNSNCTSVIWDIQSRYWDNLKLHSSADRLDPAPATGVATWA